MKHLLSIGLTLLLIGCGQKATEETELLNERYENIDSLISQSQKNIESNNQAIQKSDSVLTEKVEATVNKITTLQTENQQLKVENKELKQELKKANDAGEPFELLPVKSE